MKKRLLFTSVLVLVLLLVALSTATFAWFSASSTVNVSVVSFTASSGQTLNELALSWNEAFGDDEITKTIDFAQTKDMNPMIPRSLPYIGQDYNSFLIYSDGETSMPNFISASQVYSTTENDYFYASKAIAEAPSLCKSFEDSNKDTFYLINLNSQFGMEITVEYSIIGEIGSALCVAMFADDKLVGIMGNDTRLYYGEISQGGKISEQTSVTGLIANSGEIKFNIEAGQSCPMKLVAWYSGVQLGNSGKNKEAMLTSLQFKGEYIA